MPFRDAAGGKLDGVRVGWDLIRDPDDNLENDTLFLRFDDVKWAFPMNMIAKFLLHEYENLERSVIYQMYDADDRVIEVGGGSGVTGVSILRTGASLVVYEPQVEFLNHLATLFAMNGYPDVDVLGAAIASESGSVILSTDKIQWDATIMDVISLGAGTEVPCVGVNEAIAEHDATALHIDVEGAECNIVDALDLSKINKFTVEIHPSMIGNESYDDIIKPKLEHAGFELAAEAGMDRNYPTHNFVVGWKRKES